MWLYIGEIEVIVFRGKISLFRVWPIFSIELRKFSSLRDSGGRNY